MSTTKKRFCPYCLSALIGGVVMLGIPGFSEMATPLGKITVLMLWIPIASAIIRQAMLRAVRI